MGPRAGRASGEIARRCGRGPAASARGLGVRFALLSAHGCERRESVAARRGEWVLLRRPLGVGPKRKRDRSDKQGMGNLCGVVVDGRVL